jgi:LSM domain
MNAEAHLDSSQLTSDFALQVSQSTICASFAYHILTLFLSIFNVQTLVSFDQYNNLILHDALERRIAFDDKVCCYTDIPLGMYIVRGDSMVLMGQAPKSNSYMKKVSLEELEDLPSSPLEWDFDMDLIA